MGEAAEVLRDEGCLTVMLAAGGSEEFPEIAKVTAEAIGSGRLQGAVLVGRSGIGLCMGANRFPSVAGSGRDFSGNGSASPRTISRECSLFRSG